MSRFSRRDFLKGLAASAGILAAGRNIAFGNVQGSPLRFLVVGDSLIWGQGLEEKDKFYNLTADWLRNSAFGRPRKVELKVKAHSGANLKVHPDTAEKLSKAGLDDTFELNRELNVGFPSIWTQIETAAAEYKQENISGGAELIMLTGGITDVSVTKILDPFVDDKDLPPLIEKYCRDDMYDVLQHSIRHHPRASIVVVGYYPMLSPESPGSKLMNAWLESMGFPGKLKSAANNPVTRRLFFGRIKKKVLRRSRIWVEESNTNLQLAISNFNAKLPEPRAIFVRSPITEDESFETAKTLVFKLERNGESEDPLVKQRLAECRPAFEDLKKRTRIDNSIRRCEMAGVGHPNPAGSQAYFDEIRNIIANDSSLIRRLAQSGSALR